MLASSPQPAARKPRNWRLWAAAAVSAGLLELPFPIAGPMPPWRAIFAWFGLVPLLWALLSHPCRKDKDAARMGHPTAADMRRPLRRAFLFAYLCGVFWYTGNCYWIYDTMLIHGGLPPAVSFLILLLFSLVLGLYFGLFGLGLAFVQKRTGSTRLALLFAPFLWTALELAAARITSVPWDQFGYSQVDNGLLNQFVPWTGVYGISFFLVLLNAQILGRFIYPCGTRRELLFRFLRLSPALLLLVLGFLSTSRDTPTTATAVLIQPNLDVENTGYWQAPGEWDAHMAQFAQLAGETCGPYIAGIPQTTAPTLDPLCAQKPAHPDLVVWPESPAPYFETDPRFERSLPQIARADDAPLIVNGIGSDFSAPDRAWIDHVSAMIYNDQGQEVGRYDKIHLVPWGEYVPYAKFFFFARKLTGKVSAFTPGTERKTFLLAGQDQKKHRYGIFICYEAVFADEVRQFARNGAEVFVNISDDGWYGDTSAPWQHLNMARMRAIENRRWLLRDTNNGVTAVIDPYGRVRQSIPRHAVDALPAQFAFRSDITFYTAHGDVFAWLCVIVTIGVIAWALAKRVSRSAS